MHTLEQLHDGSLAGAVRLQLSCGLTEFPRAIFDLADTLEILDLSGNALTALPDDLPRLRRLRVLFCSQNRFTALPAILGACADLTMIGFKSNRIGEVPPASLPPALRWLILTDNCVTALPASIGRCADLQKLMLAGNLLTSLPDELANCGKLELLRIAANRLTALPAWLMDMPRLAWLAFAGNPFSAGEEAALPPAPDAGDIGWARLQVGAKLGEGASGVIYRASLTGDDNIATGARDVAVKVFKGAVTSDGLPACELAASVGAGAHPNLIAVLGKVTGHPDGVHGCVMALIDTAFRNLAGPPSLESCTRDVYAADVRLSLKRLLRLARGVAAASAQLHRRGIMHGDLYGHNILCNAAGEALLGDFGAASVFDVEGSFAASLQRVEVQAFGVLLGELIQRWDGAGCEMELGVLQALQNDCCKSVPAERPLFADIERRLDADALLESSRQITA